MSVVPSFILSGRAVGFTILVLYPFLAPPIFISTFVMASSTVSPAWRASGFISSEIPRAPFSSSSNNISASAASSLLSSSTSAGSSFLETSSTSACCSSSTTSLSSSDSNVSLSSAVGVVSSISISFSSANGSTLASACASFSASDFSSAAGASFSSSVAGASASLVSSFSETSSAGALATASFTSASATSKLPTASVSLFSTFVASTESCFSSFAAGSELSATYESLSLVSALASTLVDAVSLPPSTACAFTTVGDMKIQYPNTQDTRPTDSFLVPYLGLLLADFSFFFSIKSFNFSKILPPLIYTIYLLERNKSAKASKVDKSLLGGFHLLRFYSIPLYSLF